MTGAGDGMSRALGLTAKTARPLLRALQAVGSPARPISGLSRARAIPTPIPRVSTKSSARTPRAFGSSRPATRAASPPAEKPGVDHARAPEVRGRPAIMSRPFWTCRPSQGPRLQRFRVTAGMPWSASARARPARRRWSRREAVGEDHRDRACVAAGADIGWYRSGSPWRIAPDPAGSMVPALPPGAPRGSTSPDRAVPALGNRPRPWPRPGRSAASDARAGIVSRLWNGVAVWSRPRWGQSGCFPEDATLMRSLKPLGAVSGPIGCYNVKSA